MTEPRKRKSFALAGNNATPCGVVLQDLSSHAGSLSEISALMDGSFLLRGIPQVLQAPSVGMRSRAGGVVVWVMNKASAHTRGVCPHVFRVGDVSASKRFVCGYQGAHLLPTRLTQVDLP